MLFFDVEKQRLELKFFLKLVLEVEFSLVEIFIFRTPLEMTAREILGRIMLNFQLGPWKRKGGEKSVKSGSGTVVCQGVVKVVNTRVKESVL